MSNEQQQNRVQVIEMNSGDGFEAQHHDFPEIRAQADTRADAVQSLVFQLQRALDTALTTWRRECMEKAISEVQAFKSQG